MNKKIQVASIGVVSLLVALVVVAGFFGYQLFKAPVGQDTTEIIFDVAPGVTLHQIAVELQNKGLVRNAKAFQFYAKFKGQASKFKVGEYALTAAMTPDQIMSVLVSGKSVARSITIAEGLSIFAIADLFEKDSIGTRDEFLKLVRNQDFIFSLLGERLPSLEGYLFPETYKVTKFEGTKSVVTQMVKRFLSVWKDFAPQASQMGWTRNQVIILASIVEKETGASFERPIVSSVFHNRLKKNMRLQTDPTIMYGIALKTGHEPTNISKADLLNPGPYNSYTNSGLPPTPIANPGREAIDAVLHPAQTDYLYFVSQNNGTHVFSETLEKHNKAVQEFQMNAKARENKSWRDLKQPHK